MQVNWKDELPVAITVCDTLGTILEMNKKSAASFAKEGGYELIGKNLYECHSQNSVSKINELIIEEKSNIYTIEKNGIKKLICQTPWYENGRLKGLVELTFEIPFDMPHFIRS
jgi:transcriptional regulator with PAS, ATPase and Fis domain